MKILNFLKSAWLLGLIAIAASAGGLLLKIKASEDHKLWSVALILSGLYTIYASLNNWKSEE